MPILHSPFPVLKPIITINYLPLAEFPKFHNTILLPGPPPPRASASQLKAA